MLRLLAKSTLAKICTLATDTLLELASALTITQLRVLDLSLSRHVYIFPSILRTRDNEALVVVQANKTTETYYLYAGYFRKLRRHWQSSKSTTGQSRRFSVVLSRDQIHWHLFKMHGFGIMGKKEGGTPA